VFNRGDNRYGQLGIDILDYLQTPTRLELYNIALNKISGRLSHSLLLSNNGFIYAFGNNFYGKILCENGINEEDHTGKNHDMIY
jgi:alpha-tubulin suppressor-like RCC1 family protein